MGTIALKFLYPSDNPISFLLGMDTFSPPHELPIGAYVIMQNAALEQKGSCSKRWGYAIYGATVGTTSLLGMKELVRNDGTKYLMKVGSDGRLYQHPTTNVPIRLATPYKVVATNGTSGSVGANLVAATAYQYAIVAVDATGKTKDSTTIDANSGKVTTGATAYPVTVVGNGVYGSATYEVYRRTGTGAWGRMTSGLTHTTAGGITTVTYTDDGNTAPDTLVTPPASNTTDYTLPTSTKVDFISVRQSGNNVLFGANGAGLFWTDGTTAQIIQPSTTTLGGDTITSQHLWDVTDAVWTLKGLHYHHRYVFGADAQAFPQRFYWTDVDDPGYWPTNAVINAPDPAGGRTLDFLTKDDALVVGMTTGVFALWGTSFAVTGPVPSTNYFSRVSDVGVASEWSMVNGPNGMVLYQGADKQPHYLAALSPVKEQVVEGKLVEAISPTVQGLTDHTNCFGLWDGTQYYIFFPADKQVLRVYFFENTPSGAVRAPVMDSMPDGIIYAARLLDGTLLGADATTGQLWELYKQTILTDNGTAITWKVKSGSIGCDLPLFVKKFRDIFITHDVTANTYTMDFVVYVDTDQTAVQTLNITVADGYDTMTYDAGRYGREIVKLKEFVIDKQGHYVVVELSNSAANERPVIYGFQFLYTPKRRPEGE